MSPEIQQEPSLRDTIESSITSIESGTTPSTTSPAPPPPGGTPAAAPAVQTYGTPPAAPVAAPAPGTQVAAPAPASVGTIPPKPGVEPEKNPDGTLKQNVATVVAQKAPGTWTPEAREHWNTLPEGVRNEVIKREREVSQAMTRSTQARQFQQQFDAAIQPFMGFIAAEKSNPIQATVNMMQTAALLRTGTKSQKAEMIAGIIRNHGIDLMMLDGMLAGQAPAGMTAEEHIERIVNERLKPFQQQNQQFQTHQQNFQQQVETEVGTELEQFAEKNEFYNDLKDIMADLIEVADRRGVNMSLTDAYQRATLLHEPVRLVLEQRNSVTAAQRGHQIAQQARSGAISIKPSDETGVTTLPTGDSIRDALNVAFEKHSGR